MTHDAPPTRALDPGEAKLNGPLPPGKLERELRSGKTTCIVEMRPPDGPDLRPLQTAAARLGEFVDAFQLTDMPFATPHVANWAAAARLSQLGHEVVMNVTCRDRNLIAQQGQLLGAAALGIYNVFCIRGDTPDAGDHPGARGVFELSGLELIRLAKRLRHSGQYASGREFHPTPPLFVGAALAPHASYGGGMLELVRSKVGAGADFLVTQPLFEQQAIETVARATRDVRGRAFLLMGLGPVTTVETAQALVEQAHELRFPSDYLAQLQSTPHAERTNFGIRHALQLVDAALDQGVSGLLLYPFDCDLDATVELASEVKRRIDARP